MNWEVFLQLHWKIILIATLTITLNLSMSHELHDQPHWVAGRRYIKEQKFELAIEMFANLVQELEEEFGADHVNIAPAWFEYGNALLSAEEENPTNDILGDVKKYAKETAQEGFAVGLGREDEEDDDDDDDDDNNDEDGVDEGGPDVEGEDADPSEVAGLQSNEKRATKPAADDDKQHEEFEGDLQLAWECLEVS